MPLGVETLEGRLRALATIEATSASVRQQAERYLARLSSPVRVSLFGRPSARKLMLLDVLASTDCVTEIDSAPTFELRWGDPATAQITTADGGVTEVSGRLEASHLTDAVLVVARRPSPILRRLSFIDIAADDNEADQKAAMNWAKSRTDITLWVTETFDEFDRKLWEVLPETLKDHAYLALTGASETRTAELHRDFMGEFQDVVRIDLDGDATLGVKQLEKRLIHRADSGLQAVADSALMFMRGQGIDLKALSEDTPAPTPVATQPEPEPAADLPDAPAEPAPEPAAEARRGAETLPEPTAAVVAADARTDDARPAPVRERADAGPARGVLSTGLNYLRRRGDDMLGTLMSAEEIADHVYAAHCGETLETLTDLLTSHDEGRSPVLTDLVDMVMEAESLVILMQNETGTQPALDAVSILLQVRREFEACLAA